MDNILAFFFPTLVLRYFTTDSVGRSNYKMGFSSLFRLVKMSFSGRNPCKNIIRTLFPARLKRKTRLTRDLRMLPPSVSKSEKTRRKTRKIWETDRKTLYLFSVLTISPPQAPFFLFLCFCIDFDRK